jgi:hypothetical protein
MTSGTPVTADEKAALVRRLWRRIPVQVRRRFWRNTNYGAREPSEQLIAAIVGSTTIDTVKICAATMAADAEVIDLHDIAARLPALVKIKRDLEYRTPENGLPLANIVLTREQAVEIFTHVAAILKHQS